MINDTNIGRDYNDFEYLEGEIETYILEKICIIRDQKVILDSDLAFLFKMKTKRLNEKVKRNFNRFPVDFRFRLSLDEFLNLKSQTATSSLEYGGRRHLPYAFTEKGLIMLSMILSSPEAIKISVIIAKSFVKEKVIPTIY